MELETKAADEVSYWLLEIEAAKKREKTFREEGKRIRDIYSGEKAQTTPYNVLFANTDTMMPALYSAIPRPVVQRRYKDEDRVGKAAAKAAERMLEFQLDTNIEGYETFNEAMKASVLDALLPGRGVTSIKYEAEFTAEGLKRSEIICPQARSWNRVLFGYARKWSEMPWVAYEDHITREEAIRLFGEELAAQIKFTKGESGEGNEEKKSKPKDERYTGEKRTALVYQIWDRTGGKKIRYVSPHYKDGYLKVDDDTLELTGFFNCPKPMQFIEKTDDPTPTALYTQYENQAKELNSLTVRISRLIEALKVRGLYDAALGDDIENILQAEENTLTPTVKGGGLNAGGMDKALWFMPLDVIVATIKELYVSREQIKQTIFEIVGIADILRGSSNASETLGAQQIKTQWGTLRLKPKQGEVQRYARDLMRMMVEIASRQYNEQVWARMTGLPYLTSEQVAIAQEQAKQQIMAGAPPEQVQAQLQQQVTWQQVIEVLRDDLQRAFKIDIETNSTLEPEAAEDQKQINELMTALGTFLSGIGPMVQSGALDWKAAQGMMLAICRRYRFGSVIEDYIQGMQPPKPEDSGSQEAQAQVSQLQQQNAELKIQLKQLQAEKAVEGKAQQVQQRSNEVDLKQIQLNADRQTFDLEKKHAVESLQSRAQGETQKLEHKRAVTGLEAKQAKNEQVAAKQADAKTAEAVRKLQEQMAALAQGQQQIVEVISGLGQAPQRIATN